MSSVEFPPRDVRSVLSVRQAGSESDAFTRFGNFGFQIVGSKLV
jgi:hypothetical protein